MIDFDTLAFRETRFPPRDIAILRQDDGTLRMGCRVPLRVREASLPAYLRHQAAQRPDALWLAQRRPQGGPWHGLSFGEARQTLDSLTQGLIDLALRPGTPLAILSGNSVEHALITLAAMQAGLPVAPLSAPYSLQSRDFTKLREVVANVRPGALFVQSGAAYRRALDALAMSSVPVIAVEDPREGCGDVAYADLALRQPGPEVQAAFAAIDPHAPAKLMLTSGSTGSPKAVIQTHWNLCCAAEANLAGFGQSAEGCMVRLDWMPWSHVFGATGLATTLICGGTFYIDDGRPGGPQFLETLRNLREIAPTTYSNVPAGYAALAEALARDEVLARRFFSRLDMLAYAGARLPDALARRMQELAVRYTGFKLPLTAAYGSTETGPGGACVCWPTDRVGLIGLPQPGFELKLIPVDPQRYEVRVRSEAVMPGYYGRPELSAQVFDDEGFYRTGDAAAFVDPADPLEGLFFAGRLAEEFKLQTGTFVLVGSLRLVLLEATAPLLQDLVVCGENQAFVAVLAWLDVEAARELVRRADATRTELNTDARVQGCIAEALAMHNARNPSSSMRVVRFHLLDEPPSIDKGEITDKGSINQRTVRTVHGQLVEALFAASPDERVVDVAARL